MAADKKKKKAKEKSGNRLRLLVAIFVVGSVALMIRFYLVKDGEFPWNHMSEFLQVWKWVL